MTRVLVVDNYDSFVYTLDGYVRELGAETHVVRNDAFSVEELPERFTEYDAVLLSPGPGAPVDAGISVASVSVALESRIPLLGVCLGHQAIAEAFGGIVTNAEELMHGKTSLITHDGSAMYDDVSQPFRATRYHSLAIVDGTLPHEIIVTSRTEGGVIMGIRHEFAPLFGVQFHPESVLTEGGYVMLANWLAIAGSPSAKERARGLRPLVRQGV